MVMQSNFVGADGDTLVTLAQSDRNLTLSSGPGYFSDFDQSAVFGDLALDGNSVNVLQPGDFDIRARVSVMFPEDYETPNEIQLFVDIGSRRHVLDIKDPMANGSGYQVLSGNVMRTLNRGTSLRFGMTSSRSVRMPMIRADFEIEAFGGIVSEDGVGFLADGQPNPGIAQLVTGLSGGSWNGYRRGSFGSWTGDFEDIVQNFEAHSSNNLTVFGVGAEPYFGEWVEIELLVFNPGAPFRLPWSGADYRETWPGFGSFLFNNPGNQGEIRVYWDEFGARRGFQWPATPPPPIDYDEPL